MVCSLKYGYAATGRPDEVCLRRAHKVLSDFGTLWRNPAVPDRLREEAIREIFERFDVDGSEIVAVHPQPNENAWLLGAMRAKEERLRMQRVMGVVGARGVGPTLPNIPASTWSCRVGPVPAG